MNRDFLYLFAFVLLYFYFPACSSLILITGGGGLLKTFLMLYCAIQVPQ